MKLKLSGTSRKKEYMRQQVVLARRNFAAESEADVLINRWSLPGGLTEGLVHERRKQYGTNIIAASERYLLFKRLGKAFCNPFILILLVLAIVSGVMDIYLAEPGEEEPATVIIICTMVAISGTLRFIQETRSGNAAAKLSKLVKTTATVERQWCGKFEIALEELVVGDIIHLAAGDMIPADVRILRCKDFFVSQAALTGESEPIEKHAEPAVESCPTPTDFSCLAFSGCSVVSGSAEAIIYAVGPDSMIGETAKLLSRPTEPTGFERGVNSVSWVLIRFMLIMVPVVLFINGFTKGDWENAFLFAVSIAVGLTPEMLPMIVTTCLAKGAVVMSHFKTIIKNINAIQNLGAMDVLCTDKTGTLTQNKVVLEYHCNVHGRTASRVLHYAYLNSFYQTGLKNLMDIAIIERSRQLCGPGIQQEKYTSRFEKIDEIPFDFERRRMSVVVARKNGAAMLITKGAVEEMLTICSQVEYDHQLTPLTPALKKMILTSVDKFNQDGMRVLALARKVVDGQRRNFSVADEKGLILMGYLAFLDPPKVTASHTISALKDFGVNTKILTGDNEKVTRCICRQVGLPIDRILLGSDIDQMTDCELARSAELTNVFAKLSPRQKSRLVEILRKNGHVVGFLGDGINDTVALKSADVGISVDTAVDIAKESAAVVLLEKDLMVLKNGIVEGRKTYANMIKYIKMTASSNFGNMFSVLAASAFLPFLPMLSIHLLLLNLIYDLSCTSIPWDNVDEEYLYKPRQWNASSVAGFMLRIGPISSIFDITTYLLMYFCICPMFCGNLLYSQLTDPAMKDLYVAIFQTGWFVESMWSQTLVIHMIRTPLIPFLQSRASFPVFLMTFSGIAAVTFLPFTAVGTYLKLAPLPLSYFFWLALTILLYMLGAQIAKHYYVKRYGELL